MIPFISDQCVCVSFFFCFRINIECRILSFNNLIKVSRGATPKQTQHVLR